MDFNTYEDQLAKLERASDRIFDKIRAGEMPSTEDKGVFTGYIALMLRRVPVRRAHARAAFTEVLGEFQGTPLAEVMAQHFLRIAICDATQEEKAERIRQDYEEAVEALEQYRQQGMPRDMELKNITDAEMSTLNQVISSMRWQLFVAPPDTFFVTSDNPVHVLGNGIGLQLPYSELVFPISSTVALVASWRDVEEGFVGAQPWQVEEINRRVLSQAANYGYADRDDEQVLKALRTPPDVFTLLYPYNEDWGELPGGVRAAAFL